MVTPGAVWTVILSSDTIKRLYKPKLTGVRGRLCPDWSSRVSKLLHGSHVNLPRNPILCSAAHHQGFAEHMLDGSAVIRSALVKIILESITRRHADALRGLYEPALSSLCHIMQVSGARTALSPPPTRRRPRLARWYTRSGFGTCPSTSSWSAWTRVNSAARRTRPTSIHSARLAPQPPRGSQRTWCHRPWCAAPCPRLRPHRHLPPPTGAVPGGRGRAHPRKRGHHAVLVHQIQRFTVLVPAYRRGAPGGEVRAPEAAEATAAAAALQPLTRSPSPPPPQTCAHRRARFDAALHWQHATIRAGSTRLVWNLVIGEAAGSRAFVVGPEMLGLPARQTNLGMAARPRCCHRAHARTHGRALASHPCAEGPAFVAFPPPSTWHAGKRMGVPVSQALADHGLQVWRQLPALPGPSGAVGAARSTHQGIGAGQAGVRGIQNGAVVIEAAAAGSGCLPRQAGARGRLHLSAARRFLCPGT